MKKVLRGLVLVLAGLILATGPLAAAPFEPTVLKVSVDETLWSNYHLEPDASGDSVRALKIKRVEVAILTGVREFAVHAFSPKDAKPYTFTIPHGVPNLKLRLKAWAADDTVWTSVTDLKEAGDSVTVRSLPGPLNVHTPGI